MDSSRIECARDRRRKVHSQFQVEGIGNPTSNLLGGCLNWLSRPPEESLKRYHVARYDWLGMWGTSYGGRKRRLRAGRTRICLLSRPCRAAGSIRDATSERNFGPEQLRTRVFADTHS